MEENILNSNEKCSKNLISFTEATGECTKKIVENKNLSDIQNAKEPETVAVTDGDCKKMKIADENNKRDDKSREIKECLSEHEISQIDYEVKENEDISEKIEQLDGKPEKKNNVDLSFDSEEFREILSRIKTEENETNNANEFLEMKVGTKKRKKLTSSKKKIIKKENDETMESKACISIDSRVKTEENSFTGVKQTVKKSVKKEITSFEEKETSENEVEIIKISIPLVGKVAFQNDEKPLTNCYNLAIERNKRRFASSKETDSEILRLMKEEEKMSDSDKKKKAMREKQDTINTACYITEMCANILRELKSGFTNEKKIQRYLRRFLYSNVSPTCLLYAPHLIHTLCFIRGNKKFSRALRLAANECYNVCHSMFPIPPGCNFETVYTSEMRNFLPDDFEKFINNPLDYGDADDILDDLPDDNDDDVDGSDSA